LKASCEVLEIGSVVIGPLDTNYHPIFAKLIIGRQSKQGLAQEKSKKYHEKTPDSLQWMMP
jgi:hypothetical protein